MKKLIIAIVAVAVGAGGYFVGQSMGLFGNKAMSPEGVSAFLAARAEEINADGGLSYDTWSRLESAIHVENQLTIYANSLLKLDQIPDGADGYMETRVLQAALFLCGDESSVAALAGGARFVYQWKDVDGEELGMFSASGPTYCADSGY